MATFDAQPLTADTWEDFLEVFGANGAYDGCWCMFFRQTGAEYSKGRGKPNKAAIRDLCDEGRQPGLVGFLDGKPAGWVSIAPRPEFGRILRSPLFKPDDPDNEAVWSLVCLFIHKHFRGKGLAGYLVTAAAMHARANGAQRVDAYAVHPEGRAAADLYHGTPSMYRAAGFTEVARPNDNRVLMSLTLD